jgi:cystathionine beta-synthase
LVKDEGLLVGGSSGTAMAAAVRIAKDLNSDKRVVLLLPDGIGNYLSKHVNNDWLYENDFITESECLEMNSTGLVKQSPEEFD